MPYLMSDLAAGSTAVEQLQRNVAEAPYIQDLTKSAAERKIQEDRLATQYAPQLAAAKAEEEQMRLQTSRLQRIATEVAYQADTESTRQLQQWLSTDEGKKASDVDIAKKAAALKMQAGLTVEGANLYERAEKIEAAELAKTKKEIENNNELITKAAITLDAVPDDQASDYFDRLPEENKQAIYKQVGKENWERFSGAEKKKVANQLFVNAKGLLQEQIKQKEADTREFVANVRADVERDKAALVYQARQEGFASAEKIAADKLSAREKELTTKHENELDTLKEKHKNKLDEIAATTVSKKELEDEKAKHAKELENLKSKHKKELEDIKETGKDRRAGSKQDVKDASFYIKEHDKVVKSGEKEEAALQDRVNKAEEKLNTSRAANWYNPDSWKTDKNQDAYNKSVKALNDFRKRQIQKEIDTFTDAPDFPKKKEILNKLNQALIAVTEPPTPKEEKKETPPAAPAKPAEAKPTVPSNKYTIDNPAKPTSKEEYDKLPPDSYYIQDGVTKRKKG